MADQPLAIQIPLLEITGKAVKESHVGGIPQGRTRISEVEITVSQPLPESCYAMNIIKEPEGKEAALGVFAVGQTLRALDEVYAVGLAGRAPMVCTRVKDETQSSPVGRMEAPKATSSARVNRRRKSFMTPTPLHIPDSRVSPIPDSAHQRIYLKELKENAALMVIPLADVVWMHPLIHVVENPGE